MEPQPPQKKRRWPIIASIAAALLAIGVAVWVYAAYRAGDSTSKSSQDILRSTGFFLQKDGKYALYDAGAEHQVGTELYDSAPLPFVNHTTVVSVNGRPVILKDDGSMITEPGKYTSIDRNGTLYEVRSNDEYALVNAEGKVIQEKSDYLSSVTAEKSVRVSQLTPVVKTDDGTVILSLDGKTKLATLSESPPESPEFLLYGNYAVVQITPSAYQVVNIATSKVVTRIEAPAGTLDEVTNAGYQLDTLVLQVADKVDSYSRDSKKEFYIVHGDALSYKKSTTDCLDMTVAVLPGASDETDESVFCDNHSLSSRDRGATGKPSNTGYGLLDAEGGVSVWGDLFYDSTHFITHNAETGAIDIHAEGKVVQTLDDSHALPPLTGLQNSLPASHQGVYLVTPSAKALLSGSGEATAYLYGINGEKLASSPQKYTFAALPAQFDARGLTITAPNARAQYSVIDSHFTQVHGSADAIRRVHTPQGVYYFVNTGTTVQMYKDDARTEVAKAEGKPIIATTFVEDRPYIREPLDKIFVRPLEGTTLTMFDTNTQSFVSTDIPADAAMSPQAFSHYISASVNGETQYYYLSGKKIS